MLLILLYSSTISAKDLGTFGEIFPIIEENLLSFIQRKLAHLESSGELERHQKSIAEQVVGSIQRPLAVIGISRATESRRFYYDPSITVPYDLKDHKGTVFQKAGTKFNPLELQNLKQPLLFINGGDLEQVNWVKKYIHLNPKIILVGGSPFDLMALLDIAIYFDQGGIITKKLGIKQIPARVEQEDKKLIVSEIKLEEER